MTEYNYGTMITR